MSTERLGALYEQLEDVRATQEGAWVHARKAASISEYHTRVETIRALNREEDDLIKEIESLGGEDPDL